MLLTPLPEAPRRAGPMVMFWPLLSMVPPPEKTLMLLRPERGAVALTFGLAWKAPPLKLTMLVPVPVTMFA